MSLKPPLPPNASFASAAGGPARVVNAGNLGSAYTFALENDPNVWLIGTLNQNCTITVTGLTPGSLGLIMVTQDGTGGRTLSVSDGTTTTQVWTGGAADAPMTVVAGCEDDDTLFVSTAGATGAQGVPGTALTSTGLNVWDSQSTPESITDWGAVINTLLAADYKHLYFSEHDFPMTTQVSLDGLPGVFFEGASRDYSKLLWKGTGTTSAIAIGGGADKTFQNLYLTYDSASFTGNLVDFGTSTNGNNKFFHCLLGNPGEDALRTAQSILALRNCIAPQVIDCVIGGAESAIRGLDIVADIAANRTANDAKISHNYFQNCTVAHLTNVGRNWWITDNTFEMLDCDNVIDSDLGSGNTFTSSFWFQRNTVWDFDTATPTGVNQRVDNPFSMNAEGNWWFQKTGTEPFYKLDGPGNVRIVGDDFSGQLNGPYVDLGDSATAKKYRAIVEDCAWYGFDGSTAPVENDDSGHIYVSIKNNGGQGEAVGIGGFDRDINPLAGYERCIHRTSGGSSNPVLTAGSGLSFNGDEEIHGNHVAGWILVRYTANAGPGHIATITFAHDLWPFPANNGNASHTWQVPLLQLFPFDPSTLGTSDDYWTYKLSAEAASDQQAAVKINSGVQIPSGTRCVFGYRITQL